MYPDRLGSRGRSHPDPGSRQGQRYFLAGGRAGRGAMSPYASRWIRRLAKFAPLTLEEQRLLTELTMAARSFPANDGLMKAGDPCDRVFVILDGLVCRFKLLPDGRRQILSYLFGGDMGDPRQLLLNYTDSSMCVLRPSEISVLTPASMQRLERHPNIALAI